MNFLSQSSFPSPGLCEIASCILLPKMAVKESLLFLSALHLAATKTNQTSSSSSQSRKSLQKLVGFDRPTDRWLLGKKERRNLLDSLYVLILSSTAQRNSINYPPAFEDQRDKQDPSIRRCTSAES